MIKAFVPNANQLDLSHDLTFYHVLLLVLYQKFKTCIGYQLNGNGRARVCLCHCLSTIYRPMHFHGKQIMPSPSVENRKTQRKNKR